MNRIIRYVRKKSRGIVGIEAAIVMIAFVVIAAALAYVVINMGFYASQTAKTTIDQGIKEATSAIELNGFVTAKTNGNGSVTFLAIPIKLSVGQQQVDLSNNTVVVAVQGGNFSLADIYNGSRIGAQDDLIALMNTTYWDAYNYNTNSSPPSAESFIYDSQPGQNSALQENAKAYVVISLGDNYGLSAYDEVIVEIRPSVGAALMVKRTIPGGLLNNEILDLD